MATKNTKINFKTAECQMLLSYIGN